MRPPQPFETGPPRRQKAFREHLDYLIARRPVPGAGTTTSETRVGIAVHARPRAVQPLQFIAEFGDAQFSPGSQFEWLDAGAAKIQRGFFTVEGGTITGTVYYAEHYEDQETVWIPIPFGGNEVVDITEPHSSIDPSRSSSGPGILSCNQIIPFRAPLMFKILSVEGGAYAFYVGLYGRQL